MDSIKSCLESCNPLTRKIAEYLISYREEDERLDYKQTIEINNEKHWMELTKDIMSFANTYGGYLVVGVEDEGKTTVGLSKDSISVIKDSNKISQKVNRFIEPQIVGLRSNVFRFDGKIIGVLHVPQSYGFTHCISKDGLVKYPAGATKTILHKGTIYVRRSGGNHLGDSRDMDRIMERRLDYFKESLLNKITKVVSTPVDSDVFILSKDPDDKSGERFVIEDSPDSIPIKGMSFTVAPEGPEEEIAAYSVLSRGDINQRPRAQVVWKWYAERDTVSIRTNHKLKVFQFSLWSEAPAFYWVQNVKKSEIKKALVEAIRMRPISVSAKQFLVVASALGEPTYKVALTAFGDYFDRLNPAQQSYPWRGARTTYGTIKPQKKQNLSSLRQEKLKILNNIALSVKSMNRKPGVQNRSDAQKIDCFLYMQDEYK